VSKDKIAGAVALAIGGLTAGSGTALAADDFTLTSVATQLSKQAEAWGRAWHIPGVFRPSDSLAWPVRGKVTGRFGEPRGGHHHDGVDVPRPAGTPIRAAGDGTVVMREEQAGYGKYTCIAHVTITSCYAHQSRFAVKRRAHVRRGEVIGFVGDSGRAYAVHLHFEVRRGTRPWGKPVNPIKRLP
jgi:murein DD-endopeptidase MepM/ murein hydrolase activator NlpD